jgi:hypothetical protein
MKVSLMPHRAKKKFSQHGAFARWQLFLHLDRSEKEFANTIRSGDDAINELPPPLWPSGERKQ